MNDIRAAFFNHRDFNNNCGAKFKLFIIEDAVILVRFKQCLYFIDNYKSKTASNRDYNKEKIGTGT
jgi:hypothetical protein